MLFTLVIYTQLVEKEMEYSKRYGSSRKASKAPGTSCGMHELKCTYIIQK